MEIVQRTIKSLSVPTPGREANAASVAVYKVKGTRTNWERYDLLNVISRLTVLKEFDDAYSHRFVIGKV
jgi:hypothetical protein